MYAKTLVAAAQSKDLVEARLTDISGHVVASYLRPVSVNHAVGAVTVTEHDVVAAGKPIGHLVMRSEQPSLAALLPRFLALTGALFFGASGIALFVAQGLARRVAAPIERLSNAMADQLGPSLGQWGRTGDQRQFGRSGVFGERVC